MSTIAIAKKDFKDGIRSRVLLGLIVLFALFMASAAYYFTQISSSGTAGSGGDPLAIVVISSLLIPTYILLPPIGTMLGYKAISGERESGSLKFMLSLPHTRGDVVFGKLIGRGCLMTVAVGCGFAVGGIALYALTDAFVVGDYVVLIGGSILLGVVFVSVAIAFSSAVRSSTLATTGAITLVLVSLLVWPVFLQIVRYVAIELSLIAPSWSHRADWFIFLGRLNPTTAFSVAVTGLVGAGGSSTSPFYLEGWFGFVILGVWLVVPLGVAYLRFRNADL